MVVETKYVTINRDELRELREESAELARLRAHPARQVGGDEREYHCDYAGCSQKAHHGTSLCLEHHTPKARAVLAPAAVVMPSVDQVMKVVMRYQWEDKANVTGTTNWAANLGMAVVAEVARLNRRAIPLELLEKAADLLKNYQHVIDGCHSSEIERFDYQPEVQGTADELRALLGKDEK